MTGIIETKPTKIKPPKVKVLQDGDRMWIGYIYVNGNLLEKTSRYMSEINCINWLNERVDYHNSRKNLNIPHYVKELKNA